MDICINHTEHRIDCSLGTCIHGLWQLIIIIIIYSSAPLGEKGSWHFSSCTSALAQSSRNLFDLGQFKFTHYTLAGRSSQGMGHLLPFLCHKILHSKILIAQPLCLSTDSTAQSLEAKRREP